MFENCVSSNQFVSSNLHPNVELFLLNSSYVSEGILLGQFADNMIRRLCIANCNW